MRQWLRDGRNPCFFGAWLLLRSSESKVRAWGGGLALGEGVLHHQSPRCAGDWWHRDWWHLSWGYS